MGYESTRALFGPAPDTQHERDRRFAESLNDLGVRPESGAPMLLGRTGSLAYWNLEGQRWLAGPAR